MTISKQVWRLKPDRSAWYCGDRPIRPVPPTSLSKARITRAYATAAGGVGGGGGGSQFILGVTKPDATNTGATGTLTTYNGTVTMSTAGQVLRNMDIHGYVVVNAANCQIINCRVRGDGTTAFKGYGLINAKSTGLLVDHCTLIPDLSLWWLNGFDGNDATVQYCHVTQTVDGIDPKGSNVNILGNYVHDLSFFNTSQDHASDSRFPYWTHNDCVQISYGDAIRVEGNNFQAYYSPIVGTPSAAASAYPNRNYSNGISATTYSGRITNCSILNNWFEGGEIGIQIPAQGAGYDTGNSVTIRGNRFGADQHPYGNSYQQVRWTTSIGAVTFAQNIYDSVPSVPAAVQGQLLANPSTAGGQTTYYINQ